MSHPALALVRLLREEKKFSRNNHSNEKERLEELSPADHGYGIEAFKI